MDNLTHSLAGALIGQMGLKRRSRFAMAACLLGANAPDIDVFAPMIFPVQGISFHRGPVHGVFAWPILAAAIVAILWMLDRFRPPKDGDLPFRAGSLFLVSFLAVLTHPFLDWLTTYAIALLSPANWNWSSGDAIFIVDWVYWLLMIPAIIWSARRWRQGLPHPGRPAQIAGVLMLAYIAFNLGESARLEAATRARLQKQGIQTTLVVASPPPFAFWNRRMLWRSADRWGSGSYSPSTGLKLDPASHPLGMNDPRLAATAAHDPHLRAFLVWSRMPIVIEQGGRAFLTDQRFYGQTLILGRTQGKPRETYRFDPFLIPLDNRQSNS